VQKDNVHRQPTFAQPTGCWTEERPDFDLASGTRTRHSGGGLSFRNQSVVPIGLSSRYDMDELNLHQTRKVTNKAPCA
jgi:hypothetical protein